MQLMHPMLNNVTFTGTTWAEQYPLRVVEAAKVCPGGIPRHSMVVSFSFTPKLYDGLKESPKISMGSGCPKTPKEAFVGEVQV